MKERTTTITLGDTELPVYAGNMTVIRFKRAGGSMARLELLDRVAAKRGEEDEGAGNKPLSHDEMIDATEVSLQFIHANLIEPMEFTELVNLSQSAHEPAGAYFELINTVPWFGGSGELSGEDATGSSMSGHSPSSNSTGTQTSSGVSAPPNTELSAATSKGEASE